VVWSSTRAVLFLTIEISLQLLYIYNIHGSLAFSEEKGGGGGMGERVREGRTG